MGIILMHPLHLGKNQNYIPLRGPNYFSGLQELIRGNRVILLDTKKRIDKSSEFVRGLADLTHCFLTDESGSLLGASPEQVAELIKEQINLAGGYAIFRPQEKKWCGCLGRFYEEMKQRRIPARLIPSCCFTSAFYAWAN